VGDDRISQVRGFADQRLLLKAEPNNPSNRRISIIVRNLGLDQQEETSAQTQVEPKKAPDPVAKK
jgi:hypothetical protein